MPVSIEGVLSNLGITLQSASAGGGSLRRARKLFAARMAWRLLCAVFVFKKYTFLSCGVEEAVTGYNPWDLEAVAHKIISI